MESIQGADSGSSLKELKELKDLEGSAAVLWRVGRIVKRSKQADQAKGYLAGAPNELPVII